MIKMFKYEFKKNLKATLIVTVILLAITLLVLSNNSFVSYYDYKLTGNKYLEYENFVKWYGYVIDNGKQFVYPKTPPISLFVIIGIGLSFIYAIIEFSFKTKKIEVDAMYSLPIKRRSLYLAKYLNGLVNVLIPTLVCYIVTIIYIALSYNLYNMWGFVLYIPLLIFFIFLAFSVFAFGFTRGSRVADGVITIMFISMFSLMIELFREFTEIYHTNYYSIGYETIFAPFVHCTDYINELVMRKNISFNITEHTWSIINILMSIGCFVLFVTLVDNEKAEDAETRTDSWFSYKTFLPLYTFILISISENLLVTVIIGAAAYFVYVYKNKSFKIKLHELITLLVVIILGLSVAIYIENASMSYYESVTPVISFVNKALIK